MWRSPTKKSTGVVVATVAEAAQMARVEEMSRGKSAEMEQQHQQAQKEFSQRLDNRKELLRQQLSRQGADINDPRAKAIRREQEREGIRGYDSLAANLAAQRGEAQQKGLYAMQGLSQRQTQLTAGMPNARGDLYGTLTPLASAQFGREVTGAPGSITPWWKKRLGNPGINPNAPDVLSGAGTKVLS